MTEPPPPSLVVRFLVILGGGALLLAMAVDAVAVAGRHLGLPLLGSIELVQASVLVSAAMAMIVATIGRTHAVVHLVVDRVSPVRRRQMSWVNALLSALLFIAFLVGSTLLCWEMWSHYEQSDVLRIPFRPLRVTLVLSCAALAAIFIYQAIGGRAAMATPETGLIGILILFALLMLGTPIGVALGLVGIGGLIVTLGLEPALIKAGVTMFETMLRYELGTLPLFLLMAQLCFSANASRDIFEAAARFVGHRRGGLAYAGVGGCAAFSAINGSSLATAATIGMVALPEMRKRGYSDALATGSVAAGGTLGQLIPPSGALIVFGIIAEESIGTLFTAAIIPGITQMLFYFVAIWLVVRFRPHVAPPSPRATWRERWQAARRIVDIFLLILVVIGGIAIGWFTPTEAASVGAVGALLISAARRRLTWGNVYTALSETLRTSGLIYLVVIGALIFSVFVSVTGLADAIGATIGGLGTGPVTTMLLIAVFLLLLGSVLDGLALMLLTTPILLPIVVAQGLSPIWFGIFLVRAMEIGFVHPPIGMNLYVIQRIAKDVPLARIFKGVLPFLASDLVHLLALILFPAIVLWLPQWIGQ